MMAYGGLAPRPSAAPSYFLSRPPLVSRATPLPARRWPGAAALPSPHPCSMCSSRGMWPQVRPDIVVWFQCYFYLLSGSGHVVLLVLRTHAAATETRVSYKKNDMPVAVQHQLVQASASQAVHRSRCWGLGGCTTVPAAPGARGFVFPPSKGPTFAPPFPNAYFKTHTYIGVWHITT